MAEWNNADQEKMDPAFAAIRALFLDGTIDVMYKLIDYSPTKLSILFSMTYRTFQQKLKEPWKFSILHILLLAKVTNLDPDVITKIIQKESEAEQELKLQAFKLKRAKMNGLGPIEEKD